MKALIALFSLSILLAAAPVSTDTCKDPQTQTDMNICANQAYKKSDKVLNQLYAQLKRKYAPARFKRLQSTQIQWLKFRDAQCKFEADFYQGGTLRPLIHANCLERLTQERNSHFRSLLKGPPY